MPIAKITNTTDLPITIHVEGADYTLGPGSNLAGNFTDEEWAAAKATRDLAFNETKPEDDKKRQDREARHLETVERDKAWVKWREENNAAVERQRTSSIPAPRA
jgi:hypothetical protein